MILNASSTKKRDTMLTVSRLGYGGSAIRQPLVNAGKPTGADGVTNVSLWTATARTMGDNSTTPLKAFSAARSATTCYMRGLSETVEINTNSGAMWEWRRICFCAKIPAVAINYNDTTYGYARYWLSLSASNATGDQTQYQNTRDLLFKGQNNIDYDNIMTASIDTSHVDLKYDKTRRIASGNTLGNLRRFKLWHPMNRNLVYDDDENGTAISSSAVSVRSKPGMGDYHVLDLFKCQTQNAGDTLSVASTATLYWHEK